MRTLLKAGRLIDGQRRAPQEGVSLIIEGNRIESIESGFEGAASFQGPILDYSQATILPGLIDAHVHLTLDPTAYSGSTFIQAASEEQLYELAVGQAAQFLEAGVTTVRDMGAPGWIALRVRDDLQAGRKGGARVLSSGPVLTSLQGHAYFLGLEIANPKDLHSAVKRLVAAGVDQVKVIATGGGITPGSDPLRPQFDVKALAVIADVAHQAGRKVAAHAHSAAGIKNCLDAGIDTIEHCTFITPRGVEPDAGLIDRLAAARVHVVPTLAPWYALRDSEDPNLGFPQFGLAPQSIWEDILELAWQMRRAGVTLATGTDIGCYGLPPALFHSELEAFVQAGYSVVETISAATAVAAQALGIGDDVGTLQAGRRADLVAVSGDPGRDIGVLARPMMVMQNGQIVFSRRERADDQS